MGPLLVAARPALGLGTATVPRSTVGLGATALPPLGTTGAVSSVRLGAARALPALVAHQ